MRYQSPGSPPLAWGQRRSAASSITTRRFTPTRVGTACRACPPGPAPTVHPHSRGDSGAAYVDDWLYVGSPPLAWGQQRCLTPGDALFGFTPTRVGTAAAMPWSSVFTLVHPHSRGDSPSHFPVNVPASGSPPLAWGQPFVTRPLTRIRRFTPTRVGTAGGSS